MSRRRFLPILEISPDQGAPMLCAGQRHIEQAHPVLQLLSLLRLPARRRPGKIENNLVLLMEDDIGLIPLPRAFPGERAEDNSILQAFTLMNGNDSGRSFVAFQAELIFFALDFGVSDQLPEALEKT